MNDFLNTVVIRDLSLDLLKQNWGAFESIEERSGLTPVWNVNSFQADFPQKWNLSKILIKDSTILGYAIFSEKSPVCSHLHRIVIDQEFQGRGLGSYLINESVVHLPQRYRFLTLKVSQEKTKLFYERKGFFPLFLSDSSTYMIFVR